MTKKLLVIVLMVVNVIVHGQENNFSCDCPRTVYAGTKPDTTFHFINEKTVVLCGYKNSETHSTTFSEFVLSVCGEDSIIDFWGAVLNCRFRVSYDTLFVDQLQNLPIGTNFSFEETVWASDLLYFNGQEIERRRVLNYRIKTYTPDEIQSVINEYIFAKPEFNESKMLLANKLFMATISGDAKARHYFMEFKSKFGTLDGAFAEEYNELINMLVEWDKMYFNNSK